MSESHQSLAADDDRLESDIVALLCAPSSSGLWSEDEIAKALGDGLAVTDALERLHKAGVIHRCGGFVLITRAAARSVQLASR